MEEPIITNIPLEEEKPSRSWPKYSLFLIGILIIPTSYYGWNYYLSPEAREARSFYEDVATFQNIQNKFAGDTYGGETPEETINLFVTALSRGDLELAAKYFKLQVNGEQNPEIILQLEKLRASGKLEDLISGLKKAVPDSREQTSYSSVFNAFNDSGGIEYEILLYNGTQSKVWKIESL